MLTLGQDYQHLNDRDTSMGCSLIHSSSFTCGSMISLNSSRKDGTVRNSSFSRVHHSALWRSCRWSQSLEHKSLNICFTTHDDDDDGDDECSDPIVRLALIRSAEQKIAAHATCLHPVAKTFARFLCQRRVMNIKTSLDNLISEG